MWRARSWSRRERSWRQKCHRPCRNWSRRRRRWPLRWLRQRQCHRQCLRCSWRRLRRWPVLVGATAQQQRHRRLAAIVQCQLRPMWSFQSKGDHRASGRVDADAKGERVAICTAVPCVGPHRQCLTRCGVSHKMKWKKDQEQAAAGPKEAGRPPPPWPAGATTKVSVPCSAQSFSPTHHPRMKV